jgi:alpha-N-arabinofuranosidase
MKPHSTYVVGLHDNPSGDVQFINNLFVDGGDASQYSHALLPVVFNGNVYTKGTMRATQKSGQNKFGEMNKDAEKQMKDYKEHTATEMNAFVDNNFEASVNLLDKDKKIYLEITLDKKWLAQKRKMITTATLTKAIIPDLSFENPDGSQLLIDKDYLGNIRNITKPSPGPFEIAGSGKQKIRIW